MAFVHLHTHSSFSPMWGVPTLDALCQAAQSQGQDCLALTDTNGLYGAIRFLEVAREHGLKPILGAELVSDQHRAVLLAKNVTGYGNLCRILSARHCDAAFEFIETVTRHRTGLVLLSDDPVALTAWQAESEEDLYVELTPGPALPDAVALSRRLTLPPVATTRAAFLHLTDYQAHRLLRASAENTTLSRLKPDHCALPSHWLMPEPVLAGHLPHVPEAIANTRQIAEQCHTDWDFKQTIFPSFRQLSSDAPFETLRRKAYDGAIWRYGALSPVVRERIEKELTVIRDKGYADYFLVVDEIVRQAPRTCGRGSAAASIVSYCLSITHVDPIRHNLLFERFLNPGRHDPPDIDIDFPWDERPKILDWVFAHYGHQHAAMVANQNTLASRAALREIAKVYGLPAGEIGQALNFLQRRADFVDVRPGTTVQDWARDVCKALNLRNPWPEILYWSTQLDGHFRNLSLHPGGVVLVPDEIRRYVPVEISASNLPMIQWEKDQTEDAGLVKIDLLGNRSLAVIRDALAAVARNTGRVIDYATWDPITDPATKDLIRRGETMGCFYMESPATRLLLKKLWGGMPPARRAVADVFEYLVVVSSIIRPAANVFADEFVRRAHGQRYQSLHPLVDEVLAETHGIMVYQEDVMKVAVALGGFSVEDGDQLRKVLCKKHKERQLRDYQRQFYQEASARGVTRPVIDQIWAMIMSFAGYSFCKPHSASYAQVSFKSVYLRAHYPAEFIAAVVSNQGGYYSAFAYLSEGRRMGLTILPPDINASVWAYRGSGTDVRVGLMQIKGLQENLVKKLIAERDQHGPYRSLSDFLSRVKLDYAQAKLLIKAGCLDSIAGELTRPALLWRVFAAQATRPPSYIPIPTEYSSQKNLHHELTLFGFPLHCHPLDLFNEALASTSRILAADVDEYVGKEVTLIGWLLTEKIVSTKKGEPMEFMTLEDQTGMYDATLFPNIYRLYCHLLATNQAYVVTGLVEEHFSTVTITVKTLQLLTSGGIPAPSESLEEQSVWPVHSHSMPLSPFIRFGTSTWTYEGWQGQVYLKKYAKTTFARECLGEYCQYLHNGEPCFRTVGNDSTFYRPPTANQLRHYLNQIPEDFEMCFKVWEEITIPTYAKQARYGIKAGQSNPCFLDAKVFNELVLTPYREAKFGPHTGPFLFEFQRHGMSSEEFSSRLDTFFGQLPKDFRYAVEIRNAGLPGPDYRKVLENHGVAHVYNHWSYMPSLLDQHQRMEEHFTAPFTVLRLLTPLKMSYEAAKKRAEPYTKIVEELPEMRQDTVDLVKKAVGEKRKAYVLVNNRSEGNAPLTIQALRNVLQAEEM